MQKSILNLLNGRFNKLIFVIFLTGIGQLSIFMFSVVSVNNLDAVLLKDIGLVDNTYLIISSVISIGITQYYAKDIANESTWLESYNKSLSFRLSLSFLVFVVGLVYLLIEENTVHLILLFAPIIAINGDYALYMRGKTIQAAFSSFIRNTFPYIILSILIAMGLAVDVIGYILIVGIFLILACLLVNRYLIFSFFKNFNFKIEWNRLGKIIQVGIGTSFFNVLKNFIFIICAAYWTGIGLATIYALLKLYLMFFGVKRMVIQTYIKEIISDKITSVKINYLIGIGGLSVVFLLWLGGPFYLKWFFDETKLDIQVLHFSLLFIIVCNSFYSVELTRLLALGHYDIYSAITIVASSICLLLVWLFNKFQFPIYSIFILIGLYDLIISLSCKFLPIYRLRLVPKRFN